MKQGENLKKQFDHEKAKHEYLSGKSIKEISAQFGVKDSTIRSVKLRDGWPKVQRRHATKNKNVATLQQKKQEQPTIKGGLTDKQQLFCELYVTNFNATQSYITAYGVDYNTANTSGSRLLANDSVRAYIQSLKEIRKQAIFADETDVVEMYMKIAFASISNYVTFGRREVQAMNQFGPVTQKQKVGEEEVETPVMKTVNYVDIKESPQVDAGVISEISQGKEGVKVKLADKMKALEWLSKYFMMNPMDKHRVEYDRKKQELDQKEYERRKKSDEEWK